MSYKIMSCCRLSIAMLAGFGVSSVHAEIIEIDFDDSFYPSTELFIFLTDQLEPEYGVSFSLTDSEDDVRWYRPSGAIFGGRLAVRDPFAAPPFTYEMQIDFTEIVDFVQLSGYDGAGGDTDVLNLRAYNRLGELVAHEVVVDHFGPSGESISVIADEIAYVRVGVDATFSGLFYDDLRYNIVPTPASTSVLLLGAIAIRRRRG